MQLSQECIALPSTETKACWFLTRIFWISEPESCWIPLPVCSQFCAFTFHDTEERGDMYSFPWDFSAQWKKRKRGLRCFRSCFGNQCDYIGTGLAPARGKAFSYLEICGSESGNTKRSVMPGRAYFVCKFFSSQRKLSCAIISLREERILFHCQYNTCWA